MLKILDDWTGMLEYDGQIDVIYTDFEKAFDRVPHNRLISKLYSYNINEDIIKWIKAYLENRVQRVRLNSCFSKWANVVSGIPKGLFWDLYFLLFILTNYPISVIHNYSCMPTMLKFIDKYSIHRIKKISNMILSS